MNAIVKDDGVTTEPVTKIFDPVDRLHNNIDKGVV